MTILQWLHTIKDPEVKQRAINNAFAWKEFHGNEIEDSLSEAIIRAFRWRDTPEGLEYWVSYYNSLFQSENLPKSEIFELASELSKACSGKDGAL